MSGPPNPKRQKVADSLLDDFEKVAIGVAADDKQEEPIDICKVLQTVPRLCAFCNEKELLKLRRTSRDWKKSADQESVERAIAVIRSLPQSASCSWNQQDWTIPRQVSLSITLRQGWSSTNRETLAREAVKFGSDVFTTVDAVRRDRNLPLVDRAAALNTVMAGREGRVEFHDQGHPRSYIRIEMEHSLSNFRNYLLRWHSPVASRAIQAAFVNHIVHSSSLCDELQRVVDPLLGSIFTVLCMPAAVSHFQWRFKTSAMGF